MRPPPNNERPGPASEESGPIQEPAEAAPIRLGRHEHRRVLLQQPEEERRNADYAAWKTDADRLIAQENASTTDGTIAVVGTGTLDADAVRSMLTQLPPGTWELVTHPGYNDADLDKVRTRLRA
jgi:hypothetical protein